MSNIFIKEYEINIFDVDTEQICKFSSILNYLWDIFISQEHYLGETKEEFIKDKCVWIILKYDIDIYKYPKYKEIITVETKVLGSKKFYLYRESVIKNYKGEIICKAFYILISIDFYKRSPVKILQNKIELYKIDKELETIPILDDISKIDKEDYKKSYRIRYSDIDTNGHVNNVRYMEMAIDTLPRDILNEYRLYNIKVLFKKESNDKDILHISSELIYDNEDIITIHYIKNNNKKILTKLQYLWKKKF